MPCNHSTLTAITSVTKYYQCLPRTPLLHNAPNELHTGCSLAATHANFTRVLVRSILGLCPCKTRPHAWPARLQLEAWP